MASVQGVEGAVDGLPALLTKQAKANLPARKEVDHVVLQEVQFWWHTLFWPGAPVVLQQLHNTVFCSVANRINTNAVSILRFKIRCTPPFLPKEGSYLQFS